MFLTKNCKFVAPYWGVTWSVVCSYRYVWVWKGGYKYAWVFISPQQGLNSVFNQKLQICSNILRSYMICCVYVCMYGYEMVCISMHEYLLAPSKVWTVPQPPAGARMRRAEVLVFYIWTFACYACLVLAPAGGWGTVQTLLGANKYSCILIHTFSYPYIHTYTQQTM